MNVLVLTSETLHHLFFVKSLLQNDFNVVIVSTPRKDDVNENSISAQQTSFEEKLWFRKEIPTFSDIAKSCYLKNYS